MKRYKVIDALVIPRDLRGHGWGTSTMQKLCGWADVEEVTLVLSADSTVLGRTGSDEEDARLVKFYEQFGFRPTTAFKRILTDDIWTDKNLMERPPENILSLTIVRLENLKEEA